MDRAKPPSIHTVPERVTDRIFDSIAVHDWLDCWPWTKSVGSHGYGQVGWWAEGRSVMTTAHRVAWMAINGLIPEGFTVDHECRNKRCCNPLHLRIMTNAENATDNGQSRKTHCPHGHEYSGANLRIRPGGHRDCRACQTGRRQRHAADRALRNEYPE